MQSSRQNALLSTPRWSWLGDVLDRWYSTELCAEQGLSPAEIDTVERESGLTLPTAMREWFELVGHRLEAVQDSPARPGHLFEERDQVVIWAENQGCWFAVCPQRGDDPLAAFADSDLDAAPVSTLLQAMTLSDTVIGAWSGDRRGPLGTLAPSVRGGLIEDFTEAELSACARAYPPLAVPGNPFAPSNPRGDAETVLRGEPNGVWVEWMTATDDAFARLEQVVDLVPAAPKESLTGDNTEARR